MRGRYRGQTALLVPPRTVSSDGGASVTTMDSPYQTHQALPARSQAPTLDQAFASRGSRLAASLIDGIVAGVLMIPLFVSAVMADASGGGPAALGGALAFGLVVLLIAFVVYQLSMLVREGQTIGQKTMDIRIGNYHSGTYPVGASCLECATG